MKSVNVRPLGGEKLMVQFASVNNPMQSALIRAARDNGLHVIGDAMPNCSFGASYDQIDKLSALQAFIPAEKEVAAHKSEQVIVPFKTLPDAARFVLGR